MAAEKLEGASGKLLVENVSIPFTVTKPSLKNNLKDATDSANYDAATGRLYRGVMKGRFECDLDVDFNFYTETSEQYVLDNLVEGAEVDVVVYASQDTPDAVTGPPAVPAGTPILYGKFLIDTCDIEINAQEGEPVTGSATLQSNGKIVLGAHPPEA